MIGLLLAGAVMVGVLTYALEPLLTARIAGRPMTHEERALLGWSFLAIAMALFLLVVLIIGD